MVTRSANVNRRCQCGRPIHTSIAEAEAHVERGMAPELAELCAVCVLDSLAARELAQPEKVQ